MVDQAENAVILIIDTDILRLIDALSERIGFRLLLVGLLLQKSLYAFNDLLVTLLVVFKIHLHLGNRVILTVWRVIAQI